jgi:hypothetical protein
VTRIWTLAFPIFAAANALIGIHLLDDALVDGPHGISAWSGFATDAVPLVVSVAAVLAFRRLRPALRAWVSFVFGALAVVDLGLHVSHISRNGGPGGSDVTGLLSGLGGVVLLALAAVIVARPKSPRRASARWGARLGVLVAVHRPQAARPRCRLEAADPAPGRDLPGRRTV